MSDPSPPRELPAAAFGAARRGYDRRAVDDYVAAARALVSDLNETVAEMEGRIGELERRTDVESELSAVSAEVARILQAAREAAESMRSRATADASRWRAEADGAARETRESAEADAFAIRKAAWEGGTAMLDDARRFTEETVRGAQQDGLFITAEAERNALRLTSDARRQAEEDIRTARTDAEQIVVDARATADRILADARLSAQAAQERARALEQRRAELMNELESARASIGQLEDELDARREALERAGMADATAVRVITADAEESPEPEEMWDEDTGVRVVRTASVRHGELVDADAMADEVAELRRSRTATVPEAPEPAATGAGPAEPEGPEAEAAEPGEPGPGEPELQPESGGPAEAEAAEPEAAEPEAVEPEAVEPGPAESEPAESEAIVPEPPTPEPDEPAAPIGAVTAPDDLADLFASLRETPAPPPPEPSAPAGTKDEATASAVPPVAYARTALAADPFELRQQLLLPIENRSLRSVKRIIVDLQNRVLEELRVDETWNPDAAMFAADLGDELTRLAREAHVAGHAGAAELTGAGRTPQPGKPPRLDPVSGFVAGLTSALEESLDRSRRDDAGARRLASGVSKVFRAWRTDEAERRLRSLSAGAYNEGMAGGLAALGSRRLGAVTPGAETPVAGWELPDEPESDAARLLAGAGATVVPVD